MTDKTNERTLAIQKETIIMILRESDHLMTAKEIADILGISQRKVNALLTSLVKEGIVVRPYNHNDFTRTYNYNDLSNHTNHSKPNQTKEIPTEYKIYLKLIELVKKLKNHFNPPLD